MFSINRPTALVIGVSALAATTLVGCSSNSDSNPSASPTTSSASPTMTSGSPSPTSSPITTYQVAAGSNVKIAGAGAGTWNATGGTMIVKPNGKGALAGRVDVAARSTSANGAWNLTLRTNGDGTVTGGSLISGGRTFNVTGSTGKINYMTAGNSTTLVSVTDIPVQEGTETPTTMTLNVTGNK